MRQRGETRRASFNLRSIVNKTLKVLLSPLGLVPFINRRTFLMGMNTQLKSGTLISLNSGHVVGVTRSTTMRKTLGVTSDKLTRHCKVRRTGCTITNILNATNKTNIHFLHAVERLGIPVGNRRVRQFLCRSREVRSRTIRNTLSVTSGETVRARDLLGAARTSVRGRLSSFLNKAPALSGGRDGTLNGSLNGLLPRRSMRGMMKGGTPGLLESTKLSKSTAIASLLRGTKDVPSLNTGMHGTVRGCQGAPVSSDA